MHRSGFRNLRAPRSPMRRCTGQPNPRPPAPHRAQRPRPLDQAIPMRRLGRMPPSDRFPTRRIVRRLAPSGRRARQGVRTIPTHRLAQLTRRARGIQKTYSTLGIPLIETTRRRRTSQAGPPILVFRSRAVHIRILRAAIVCPEMLRDRMSRTETVGSISRPGDRRASIPRRAPAPMVRSKHKRCRSVYRLPLATAGRITTPPRTRNPVARRIIDTVPMVTTPVWSSRRAAALSARATPSMSRHRTSGPARPTTPSALRAATCTTWSRILHRCRARMVRLASPNTKSAR